MTTLDATVERWSYAELELRYGRGHERPARIVWTPPQGAERITLGMPAEADPLTVLVERLGGSVPPETSEATEVDLLNVLGERGWRLVATRTQDAGSGERRTSTFVRPRGER